MDNKSIIILSVMIIIAAIVVICYYSLRHSANAGNSSVARRDFWFLNKLYLPAESLLVKDAYTVKDQSDKESLYQLYREHDLKASRTRALLDAFEEKRIQRTPGCIISTVDQYALIKYSCLLQSPFIKDGQYVDDIRGTLISIIAERGKRSRRDSVTHMDARSVTHMDAELDQMTTQAKDICILMRDLQLNAHLMQPTVTQESPLFSKNMKEISAAKLGKNGEAVRATLISAANNVRNVKDSIGEYDPQDYAVAKEMAPSHIVLETHNSVGICAENAASLLLILESISNDKCGATILSVFDIFLSHIDTDHGSTNWFVQHIVDMERILVLNFGTHKDMETWQPGGLIREARQNFLWTLGISSFDYRDRDTLRSQYDAYRNGINVLLSGITLLRSFISVVVRFVYPATLFAAQVPLLSGGKNDTNIIYTAWAKRNTKMYKFSESAIGALRVIDGSLQFRGTRPQDIAYHELLNVICWKCRNTTKISLPSDGIPLLAVTDVFSVGEVFLRYRILPFSDAEHKNAAKVIVAQTDHIKVGTGGHSTLFVNPDAESGAYRLPKKSSGNPFTCFYDECKNSYCPRNMTGVNTRVDGQHCIQLPKFTLRQRATLLLLNAQKRNDDLQRYLHLLGVNLANPLHYPELSSPSGRQQPYETLRSVFGNGGLASSLTDISLVNELDYAITLLPQKNIAGPLAALLKKKVTVDSDDLMMDDIDDTDDAERIKYIESNAGALVHLYQHSHSQQRDIVVLLLPLLRTWRFALEPTPELKKLFAIRNYYESSIHDLGMTLRTASTVARTMDFREIQEDEDMEDYSAAIQLFPRAAEEEALSRGATQELYYAEMTALTAKLRGELPLQLHDPPYGADFRNTTPTLEEYRKSRAQNVANINEQIGRQYLTSAPQWETALDDYLLKEAYERYRRGSIVPGQKSFITRSLLLCLVLIYYDDHTIPFPYGSESPLQQLCTKLVTEYLQESSDGNGDGNGNQSEKNVWSFFRYSM